MLGPRIVILFFFLISCNGDKPLLPLHSRTNPCLLSKKKCRGVFQQSLHWLLSREAGSGVREVMVPGYWHEQHPDLAPAGTWLYSLEFEFRNVGDLESCNALRIEEIPSASLIRLNGKVIGRTGRMGNSRDREKAELRSRIFPIGQGILRLKNRLEITITNHHARSGGILGIALGDHSGLLNLERRRIILGAAEFGMLVIAALLFLSLGILSDGLRALIPFALLLLLVALRIFLAAGWLEVFGPGFDLIDLRILLEYLSGVSLWPPLFFIFLILSFPERIDRFSILTGVFVAGGSAVISFYCLVTRDASVYGSLQPWMIRLYLLPSVILFTVILVRSVHRRGIGNRILWIGFCLLLPGVIRDMLTSISGESYSIISPISLAIFVLFVAIHQGKALRHIREAFVVSNERLRYYRRRLPEISNLHESEIVSGCRFLKERIERVYDQSLSLLNNPSRREIRKQIFGLKSLQGILERIEEGRIHGNECVKEFSVYHLKEMIPILICEMERTWDVKYSVQVEGEIPPVRADAATLRTIFREITANATGHGGSGQLRLRVHPDTACRRVILIVRNALAAPSDRDSGLATSHSPRLLFDLLPETGLGLRIIRRAMERHEGGVAAFRVFGRRCGYFEVRLTFKTVGNEGESMQL